MGSEREVIKSALFIVAVYCTASPANIIWCVFLYLRCMFLRCMFFLVCKLSESMEFWVCRDLSEISCSNNSILMKKWCPRWNTTWATCGTRVTKSFHFRRYKTLLTGLIIDIMLNCADVRIGRAPYVRVRRVGFRWSF